MHFLAPALALFAVLVVAPPIIHLIGRQHAERRRFAAVVFLRRALERVARRHRLKQIVLIALRALAIAAVPLLLAKPFVERPSQLPASSAASQSAVIVLDNSLSMSFRSGSETLLDRAKARASELVHELGPDADAGLVLATGGRTVALTADRKQLAKAIRDVRATFLPTDLLSAVARAEELLQHASHLQRRVYVISDLAAHGLSGHAAPTENNIEYIDVTEAAPRNNLAIIDLRVDVENGGGMAVAIEIANFSDAAAKQLPVTLKVAGKAVARAFIDLDAHEKSLKRFKVEVDSGKQETVAVEAQIGADALKEDNTRLAVFSPSRRVRVLLVDGDPRDARRADELFYLQAALQEAARVDGTLQVRTSTVDRLSSVDLAQVDVVAMANVKYPIDSVELRLFVERGGGLLVSFGDNVDVEAANQSFGDLLPAELQAVRGAEGGRPESLALLPTQHPLAISLGAELADKSGLGAVQVSRYVLFRAPRKDAVELFRLSSGAPALLERRVGKGRVLAYCSTLDRDWNDLPIQPIFLPLIEQIVRSLGGGDSGETPRTGIVGRSYEVALADVDRVSVAWPSSRSKTFNLQKGMLQFSEGDEAGIYQIKKVTGETVAAFALGISPDESDLKPATLTSAPKLEAASLGPFKRSVELWHALGAALLLLLLGEAIVTRR